MPALDESFPEEVVETTPPAEATAAPVEAQPEAVAAEPTEDFTAEPEATTEPTEAEPAEEAAEEPAEVAPEPTAAAPAFNEPEYLKQVFGEQAPATVAEAKQRFDELQAKQITPEQQTRLAMLDDPAKLAEFAQLATQDFSKMEAVEAMRAHFAQRYPKLSEAAREHRFQSEFEQKYPTLAAAIANPEEVNLDDPKLAIEKELADADADENRAALASAQEKRVADYMAAQVASRPQLSPEQLADANSLNTYLDTTFKPGATLPLDLGEGGKLELPIDDPAAFKAAYADTYRLLDNFTLTKPLAEGGVLNRANHALVTAFLQNPVAFAKSIAQQARAAQPLPEAAMPLAAITNSSASKVAAAKKAAPTAQPAATGGERNHSPYIDADAWHNSNV